MERDVAVEIRFYIDPESDEPHIFEHDVTEDEVVEVLRRAGEDRAGDEGSRVALGQTATGRYVKVIYVRDPGSLFVITAYDLRGKGVSQFMQENKKQKPAHPQQRFNRSAGIHWFK